MPSLKHGSRVAYRGGCRCTKCRAWKAADMANYRAAKKPADAVPAASKRTTNVGRPTRPKTPPRPARILGAIERDLSGALDALGDDDNPWTKPLRASALALARSADEGDPALVGRVIPQLLVLLERLGLDPVTPARAQQGVRSPVNQPDGVPDDDDAAFIAGLRRAD